MRKKLDKTSKFSDTSAEGEGWVMSEEQLQEYLERLQERGERSASNPEEAQKSLESAGICDSNGELTDLYK